MQKTFNCTVYASNSEVFEVSYHSSYIQGDPFKPCNIIREVLFCGYVLALGQLRERSIWHELTAAVDNNSYDQWERYCKKKSGIDTSNIHPAFAGIFESLASITKPEPLPSKLEDVANISQQGEQC